MDEEDAQVKRWERKRRNREKAVREIVSTEKTYIQALEFIINEYQKPLSQGRPRLIPNEQVSILCPMILSNILIMNNKLLHDLETKVLANYDNESTPLAYLFKDFVPYFKMYTNYVNNHEKAVTELRHLNDNEKFLKYCKEKMSICNGLDLSSLLIQPIQRIPRYELLIREVLGNTHESHPDKEELDECYQELKKMNSKINHSMDEHKRREAVRIVEDSLGGAAAIGFDLVGPARRLVKQGKFFKMSRAKNIEYTFFLFSDMLLYCSDRGNNQFKLHKKLPINDAFSIQDVSEAEQKNGFILYNSVKSFKAFASSATEKREWFDAMDGCVREYRIRRPQLPKRPDADEEHVAAIWDADGKECVLCAKKFGFVTRRHHCRRCGRLVCHDCSKYRLPSLMKKKTTVYERACKICFKDYNDQGGDNSKSKVVDGDAASILLGSEKMGGPEVAADDVPSDTSSCERCKAMYDYEAEYENDLSFKTDDIILILEQKGDWWKGMHEDKSKGKKPGLFPSNYVEVIQGPKEGDIYVAICNYNAESKEELTLRQGERYVLNVVDASGWWLVSSEANKNERGWTSPQLVQKASEYQEPEEEEVIQPSNNFTNAGEIDPITHSEPVNPEPTPSPQQTAIDPRLKNLVSAHSTTTKRQSGLPRPSVKQKAKASPPPTPVVEKKHSAISKFQKRTGPKTFSLGATQASEKAPTMAPPPPPSGVVKKQSMGPKSPKPKPVVAPLEDMNSGAEDSGKNYYSYQELTSMKLRNEVPDGVDATKLENYLCDEEFEEIFGMTRDSYDKLATWKKKKQKQKAKLW